MSGRGRRSQDAHGLAQSLGSHTKGICIRWYLHENKDHICTIWRPQQAEGFMPGCGSARKDLEIRRKAAWAASSIMRLDPSSVPGQGPYTQTATDPALKRQRTYGRHPYDYVKPAENPAHYGTYMMRKEFPCFYFRVNVLEWQ